MGAPFVAQELEHPTVRALMQGSLDEGQARYWLEQDYLYLLEEIGTLARLAWQAPATHQPDLIDLAWGVIHDEIPKHRRMCAGFAADLEGARMGEATRAYTAWLRDCASDYGLGMVALLSGLWGYSTLGSRMSVPVEPRLRQWVESYKDPGFKTLTARFADMLSELVIDSSVATEVFAAGMRHAIAFWSVPQT